MAKLSPDRRRKLLGIVSRLSSYEPQEIIVFGSFARNESDDVSDVDLVIIKETEDDFFSRIRRVMQLLDPATGIDVLVYTPAEFEEMKERGSAFIETVLEEGLAF
jgi:predicted nucleotidyltransferase